MRYDIVFDVPVPMIEKHADVEENEDTECDDAQPVEVVSTDIGGTGMKLVGLCFHDK